MGPGCRITEGREARGACQARGLAKCMAFGWHTPCGMPTSPMVPVHQRMLACLMLSWTLVQVCSGGDRSRSMQPSCCVTSGCHDKEPALHPHP